MRIFSVMACAMFVMASRTLRRQCVVADAVGAERPQARNRIHVHHARVIRKGRAEILEALAGAAPTVCSAELYEERPKLISKLPCRMLIAAASCPFGWTTLVDGVSTTRKRMA